MRSWECVYLHNPVSTFWMYVLWYIAIDLKNNILAAWQYSADFRYVPSQWETPLLCNDVSHWLAESLESALQYILVVAAPSDCVDKSTLTMDWDFRKVIKCYSSKHIIIGAFSYFTVFHLKCEIIYWTFVRPFILTWFNSIHVKIWMYLLMYTLNLTVV